jgi:oxygen-independent coproporphyrinogen-3 oxidase
VQTGIAGVYIHVPFCEAKCGYCAFNSRPLADRGVLDRYLAALDAELNRWRTLLADAALRTIYFGGGTPSLVAPSRVAALIGSIRGELRNPDDLVEITLEANPATLTADNLRGFRAAGVNRLSIGVQSFDHGALDFLECSYRADRVPEIMALAREAGFANIGLDLIVGLPEPYHDVYRADLEQALALSPEHLSVYLLTVEEPSRLHERVRAGELKKLDDERQADIFLECHERLTQAGYEHYEVSNYARPGYRSRHNSLYWSGELYWGLGAGAHSYLQRAGRLFRRGNVADPNRYVQAIEQGREPADFTEWLTPSMIAREKIMLALRTGDGLAPADFGDLAERIFGALSKHTRDGRFTWDGHRFRPTPTGFLLADAIAAELWEAYED